MKQTIYIDILVGVNLFINYFLLLITAHFMCAKWKPIRLVFGELLSGLFSLYILIPEINIFLSIIVKILMSVIIVLTVFGFKNIKIFLKLLTCFYITSFAFSGTMFALWIIFKPNGMAMGNGIVYFNISPAIFVISTIVCYFIIETLNRFLGKSKIKNFFCTVTVIINNKSNELKAKIDTGNLLREPFSNLPVIVMRKSYANKIIPNCLKDYFNANLISDDNAKKFAQFRIRMIPVKTVSGNAVFPAFRPDAIITSDGIRQNAYIAICPDNTLSPEIEALINPDLINT